MQSVALIVSVARDRYSRTEIAAAYLTVIVDSVLLLVEAHVALNMMELCPLAGQLTLGASAVVAVLVGLSGLPVLIAKFKSSLPRLLMLSLPLLTGFAGICFLFSVFRGRKRSVRLFFWRGLGFISLIGAVCVSPALGVLIFMRADNLSLAFLVISILYPAILTFVVILLRAMVFAGEIGSSRAAHAEQGSSPA